MSYPYKPVSFLDYLTMGDAVVFGFVLGLLILLGTSMLGLGGCAAARPRPKHFNAKCDLCKVVPHRVPRVHR